MNPGNLASSLASALSGTRAGVIQSAFATLIVAMAFSVRASDTCQVIYDASVKTLQTPHHVYSIKTTANGTKTPPGESIYAGGVEYVLIAGNWKRSKMTPQDMIDVAKDKLNEHSDSCSSAVSETVNGQAVATYKVHSNESGSDSEVRILTSSGLLLGQSVTLPDNAHMDIRYEYSNVRPPTGVN